MGDYKVKHPTTLMDNMPNESIMFFGEVVQNKRAYRLFYGIGKVYRVVKGEKLDLVYVNFGITKERKPRVVIAINNHARRQTLTLKRGQVCQVYGMCRYAPYEYQGKKRIRLGIYAESILGWYVPTMMDIKKMPTNTDLVAPSDKEKDFMENYDEILDSFTNGKEDL